MALMEPETVPSILVVFLVYLVLGSWTSFSGHECHTWRVRQINYLQQRVQSKKKDTLDLEIKRGGNGQFFKIANSKRIIRFFWYSKLLISFIVCIIVKKKKKTRMDIRLLTRKRILLTKLNTLRNNDDRRRWSSCNKKKIKKIMDENY